jgi:hypothetical protein
MRALHSHHTLPAASHCVCVCVPLSATLRSSPRVALLSRWPLGTRSLAGTVLLPQRQERLCLARQERLWLARSTSQARSAQSPAAAERRPARGSPRARSGPCATATPAVSTLASCHRHQRCQSAAPLPLCTKFRSSPRELICRQSSQRMAKPQQGKGTHTFSDGTYTGEWRRDKRHGQGAMAYTSGARSVRHTGGCAGG